jgi:hypothetical protein
MLFFLLMTIGDVTAQVSASSRNKSRGAVEQNDEVPLKPGEDRPLDVPATLAAFVPGGALAFVETSGLADLLEVSREADLFRVMESASGIFRIQDPKGFDKVESKLKLASLILRMNLWEAGARLLGGKVCLALYPNRKGEDPYMVILIRPAQRSGWLGRRVLFAPLARIGLKRIEQKEMGEGVVTFRTRGDEEKATSVSFHEEWIVVATSLELLKRTVAIQRPVGMKAAPGEALEMEAPFRAMAARMGGGHLARAFIDTRRVAEAAGDDLGLQREIQDPIESLFLGTVAEVAGHSRYAGMTLDYGDKQLRLAAKIDARPEEVDERYRLFFSENAEAGVRQLPEIDGLIGGVSLYRRFSEWYRNRDQFLKGAGLPGMANFEESIAGLLLGRDREKISPVVGDRLAFVSAITEDGGADSASGLRLPGLAFIVDLASIEKADAELQGLFASMLTELKGPPEEGRPEWSRGSEIFREVAIHFASRPGTGAGLSVPLVPSVARVGERFVISSSLAMCRRLIEALQEREPGLMEEKDLAFHLRFPGLADYVAANHAILESELVKGGRKQREAAQDLAGFSKVMQRFESLSGSSTTMNGVFEFEILGQFR